MSEPSISEPRSHRITVRLVRDYQFVAEVDGHPNALIRFDEPEPLRSNRAPNAAAVLGAAVGNCLATSLAFCLRKSHVTIEDLTAHITTHVARNEKGRFGIIGIDVDLEPDVSGSDAVRLARCGELFEDFCIVTESVRKGIPVNVSVLVGDMQPTAA